MFQAGMCKAHLVQTIKIRVPFGNNPFQSMLIDQFDLIERYFLALHVNIFPGGD